MASTFEKMRQAYETYTGRKGRPLNPKPIRRDGALYPLLELLYPQEPPEIDNDLLDVVFDSMGASKDARRFILYNLVKQGLAIKKTVYTLHPHIWDIYIDALKREPNGKTFLEPHTNDQLDKTSKDEERL